tara:strand:- start:1855 stop:2151 length:297 start_codon:yes stop_codon:yes gene_type:complete
MSETPTAPPEAATETKNEWTFDRVWDDFVNQLLKARSELKTAEDELDKNASLMTRIDLTELNDARNKVLKLEGACEALDLVRTAVIGAESRITRGENL